MTLESDLTRWRTLMGRAVQPWVDGPNAYGAVGERSWAMVTGAPSPDMNLVLVHEDDPALLEEPLAELGQRRCPSLVMLAGPGKALLGALPPSFSHVGEMPVMSADLSSVPRQQDPRVRPAGPDDVATVTELVAGAYGLSEEVAAVCAAPAGRPGSAMTIYLLEDDGRAVSTVTISRTDEVASIWGMGTPEQHGRKGYGRALLGSVLQTAYDDGAAVGLLGATPAGLPLYEATGWRTVESWDVCTNATSEQFSH